MEREYLNTKDSLFTEDTVITKDMNNKVFFFRCGICGIISEKRIYFKNGKLCYYSLNCTKCNRKLTNLKKYGCENPFQNEKVKEKIRDTCTERYGSYNVNKIKSFRERIENTRKERYGEHKESITYKCKQTWLKNYGVDNPQKDNAIKEKTKNTNILKYGGVPNCFGTDEFKQSMINKYGTEHALQCRDIRISCVSKYYYDDKYFDSSWELYVYIYMKEHNIDFEYHPCEIEYEIDNKKHKYTPDFKINNRLIEIKGTQFFRNGELYNPYTKKSLEYMRTVYNENKVLLLTEKDIINYIEYVDEKYGKTYIKSFLLKKST